MRQQVWWAIESGASARSDSLPEVFCVSIDYDCGKQIQASHSVVLTFSGSISDFSLATYAQGVFQGVVRLAFVETVLPS